MTAPEYEPDRASTSTGRFSGVLPISAVACASAIGADEITPERLAAMAVFRLGITLGMRVPPMLEATRGAPWEADPAAAVRR